MQTYVHPRSGATIIGVRLPPGSVISENDYYDSTMGSWEPAGGIAGLKLQEGCSTIWVHPVTYEQLLIRLIFPLN